MSQVKTAATSAILARLGQKKLGARASSLLPSVYTKVKVPSRAGAITRGLESVGDRAKSVLSGGRDLAASGLEKTKELGSAALDKGKELGGKVTDLMAKHPVGTLAAGGALGVGADEAARGMLGGGAPGQSSLMSPKNIAIGAMSIPAIYGLYRALRSGDENRE